MNPCDLHLIGRGVTHASVEVAPTEVDDETFQASLEFHGQEESGEEHTGITIGPLPREDLRHYHAVAMRAHNPTDEPIEIGLAAFGLGMGAYFQKHHIAPRAVPHGTGQADPALTTGTGKCRGRRCFEGERREPARRSGRL
ncbi:MAG: hypothetical protein CMJ18_10755 [Phycisphaeraceae bacterium]|nr:hypothetical protein [Phycisphaeraceae bacterium]